MLDPATKTLTVGAVGGAIVAVMPPLTPYVMPAIWGGAGGLIAIAMIPADPAYTFKTGVLRVLASAAVSAIATRGLMRLFGLESTDVETLIAGFLGLAAPVIVRWVVQDGWAWALAVIRKMIGVSND